MYDSIYWHFLFFFSSIDQFLHISCCLCQTLGMETYIQGKQLSFTFKHFKWLKWQLTISNCPLFSQYYNVWLSLFGFALCVAIMFLIHWVSSLITFIVILALYLVVMYRKPDVNWGSTTQAQTYKSALTSAYRLQQIDDHVKNYRPQILVLAGTLQSRPPLVDLANLITKHNSLMIVGDVVPVSLFVFSFSINFNFANRFHFCLCRRKFRIKLAAEWLTKASDGWLVVR